MFETLRKTNAEAGKFDILEHPFQTWQSSVVSISFMLTALGVAGFIIKKYIQMIHHNHFPGRLPRLESGRNISLPDIRVTPPPNTGYSTARSYCQRIEPSGVDSGQRIGNRITWELVAAEEGHEGHSLEHIASLTRGRPKSPHPSPELKTNKEHLGPSDEDNDESTERSESDPVINYTRYRRKTVTVKVKPVDQSALAQRRRAGSQQMH